MLIAREYGQSGACWVHDSRTGMMCLVPDDFKPGVKKRREVHGLCWELTGADYSRRPCGRPVVDASDHLCKMHRAGVTRREANTAKWRAEWDQRERDRQRADAQTDDLRTLWAEVCGQRDVMRPNTDLARMREDGMAVVDGEVLQMLLRELLDYGQM